MYVKITFAHAWKSSTDSLGKVKSTEKYSEGANQMEYCQKTYSF